VTAVEVVRVAQPDAWRARAQAERDARAARASPVA
jgi:hypothetical protein